MFVFSKGDSRELLVAAVVLASVFAKDQGQDEIDRMAAFFTLMGDILALLALQPGLMSGLSAAKQAAHVTAQDSAESRPAGS